MGWEWGEEVDHDLTRLLAVLGAVGGGAIFTFFVSFRSEGVVVADAAAAAYNCLLSPLLACYCCSGGFCGRGADGLDFRP